MLGVASAFGYDQTKGVLFPQFTPEKGSYDMPAAHWAKSPMRPWSATTLLRPPSMPRSLWQGRLKALKREIVDYSCYLQLGKHGGKHRDCGQKCLKAGMPIGLLTEEGKLYLLMGRRAQPAP